MTLKEKALEMEPWSKSDKYLAGIIGCPDQRDFLDLPDWECYPPGDCEACWNREYKEVQQ